MKRTYLLLSILLGLLLCPLNLCSHAELADEINAVLADKLLVKAKVGVEFVRLGKTLADSEIYYQHNSTLPLIPASNLKVVTTSAALDHLGGDFRFRTLLVKHGDDLIIIGDGDPTTGDVEMLKKVGWDITTVFKTWGETLQKKGINQFNNLIVDDSIFEEPSVHKAWPADQFLYYYCAEVGGLNLNCNRVDFAILSGGNGNLARVRMAPLTDFINIKNTCISGGKNAVGMTRNAHSNEIALTGTCPPTGSVAVSMTIHDSSMFAGTVLAETFRANGIGMNGKVIRDRTVRTELAKIANEAEKTAKAGKPAVASDWQVLAVHETPINQVLTRANKDSVNLYAESLCKRLGYAATGNSGSWENGTAAIGTFLKMLGVAEAEFKLDDGSGLSNHNRVSPNAMIRVLAYDYFSANREMFLASLSVSGADGTLKTRFANTDLKGRVIGKSGFINQVSTLSGYLQAKDGNYYAFSILMNNIPDQSNSLIKPLHEAIVRAVDKSVDPANKRPTSASTK